ncbi:hypothetical protein NQ318_004983 [Aromia moschata]|uniref:Annexin n=1 Tax=Aromia moschata TaxID=1265417 RepID=A0AAV8X7X0_9CUCU|nr:hypothetical protein NQ318_004983 [Aromia moschata]
MTSQVYIESIIRPIFHALRAELGDNLIFMDDNARPHRGRTVQEVLEQGDITRLDWPANSPNMNPIENMWEFVSRAIRKRMNPPQNAEELTAAAIEEWNNIPQETINHLIVSMHRRVNISKITPNVDNEMGQDLIKELKSELRGNFEDLIIALMTEPIEFQAKQLHKAISGLGTDESTIVEILSVYDNENVVKIANEYEGLYQTSLEADIKGDTSGTLKRLLVSLSTESPGATARSDTVDKDAAFQDAQALLQAGELLFAGTDESTFNQVMCQRNRPQLRLVFEEYEKLVGHPIETAIENEFSGTIKDALLQLIECQGIERAT